ncbi:MAG TPA: ACP S-malonyltransferase [Phycisphaerales bacterium]|nr:ACP S-malonyltransferase [Phycisphaerales bacterium]HMP37351.1 ACP S-malonyltransferase [Phycisphaerales bacterium]
MSESVVLCPGQGAQAVGMGRGWAQASAAARRVFEEADAILRDGGVDRLGAPLSSLCFEGPAERLNRTDASQPAIFTVSIACHAALRERGDERAAELGRPSAAAGLSLGEYTALCLAGAFDFAEGLRLVATRGKLMQEAAEASRGGMVALMGADEAQAQGLCDLAAEGDVLVAANFNAPGQIVLSGHAAACERAVGLAGSLGCRATPLVVAGAFHSPLMRPAADRMAESLAAADLRPPAFEVWSNVTAQPHPAEDLELLRRRLVEQIVSPVRWSQTCATLAAGSRPEPAPAASRAVEASPSPSGTSRKFHELAPGTVLKGLLRRIDRSCEVINHDQP